MHTTGTLKNTYDFHNGNDGGYLLATTFQTGTTYGNVKIRRWNPGGGAIISDLSIYSTSPQKSSTRIRQAKDGTLIVSWTDGTNGGVYMLLTPSHTAKKTVSVGATGAIINFPLDDGNIVIAWTLNNDINARKIDTTGNILQEWTVNTRLPNNQVISSGTSLADGRLFIAWESYPEGSNGYDIYYASFCLNDTQCWYPTASICETAYNLPPKCKPCNADADCSHVPAATGRCLEGICELSSYLSLTGPSNITGEEDITLQAFINPVEEEHFYIDISFVWSVNHSCIRMKTEQVFWPRSLENLYLE